jgi:chemotaxis protein CheD
MSPVTVTLHPGDVACVDRGDRMETLLGSCVAILLTDPRRTVGAMCHVVHAGTPTGRAVMSDTAYGEAALANMGRQLRDRGIDPHQCLAWVYGGGNMFPEQIGDSASQGNVGAANLEWALGTLHRAGICVLGVDLGGHAYRKLRWTVGTHAPDVETMQIPRSTAATGSKP